MGTMKVKALADKLRPYINSDGYFIVSELALSIELHLSHSQINRYSSENGFLPYSQYVYDCHIKRSMGNSNKLKMCRLYYMDKYRLSQKEFSQLLKNNGLTFDFNDLSKEEKIRQYIKDGLLCSEIETIHRDTGLTLKYIKQYLSDNNIPQYSDKSYADKCIEQYVKNGEFIKKTTQICSELLLAKSQVLKFAKKYNVALKRKNSFDETGIVDIIQPHLNSAGIFMADIEEVANNNNVHYLTLRQYLIDNNIPTAGKVISELNKKYKPYLKETLLGSCRGKEKKVSEETGFSLAEVTEEIELYCESYKALKTRSSITEKMQPYININNKTLLYSYSEIARRIGVQYRTVSRWAVINGYKPIRTYKSKNDTGKKEPESDK